MGLPAPFNIKKEIDEMNSLPVKKDPQTCGTGASAIEKNQAIKAAEIVIPEPLTVRHLAKMDPEYYHNQYGPYQSIKEYFVDQLETHTCDDLIKAWLVLDIFCDIMGEGFVIPYGSPDPETQAKIILQLILDSLLEEEFA